MKIGKLLAVKLQEANKFLSTPSDKNGTEDLMTELEFYHARRR